MTVKLEPGNQATVTEGAPAAARQTAPAQPAAQPKSAPTGEPGRQVRPEPPTGQPQAMPPAAVQPSSATSSRMGSFADKAKQVASSAKNGMSGFGGGAAAPRRSGGKTSENAWEMSLLRVVATIAFMGIGAYFSNGAGYLWHYLSLMLGLASVFHWGFKGEIPKLCLLLLFISATLITTLFGLFFYVILAALVIGAIAFVQQDLTDGDGKIAYMTPAILAVALISLLAVYFGASFPIPNQKTPIQWLQPPSQG